ncbi:MAG: aquaporin [Pseudanabaenaceae cyanobacterium]
MVIGLTVGVAACAMGPIIGTSMNPARSLAPALASGLWQHHWVYWLASILGAQLVLVVYRYLGQGLDFPAQLS